MLVFDSKEVYVGSANLTGAGIGMKTDNKRNFEAGILTDETEIVEQAMNGRSSERHPSLLEDARVVTDEDEVNQFAARRLHRRRAANNGQCRRRMRQLADARHRLFADVIDPINSLDSKPRAKRLFHELLPFHDEQSPLLAELLLSQRPDVLYLILRYHS